MNDPIFRIMNGTDFRSTVYLIHVLAGSKRLRSDNDTCERSITPEFQIKGNTTT